jgi:hypothetical protein
MSAFEPITIDPVKHRYSRDKREFVAVTSVCREVNGNVDHYSEEARQRGTFVHRICHFYDEHDLNESTVDPNLRGYLDAYIKYQTDGGIKDWDLIEQPMCEPFRGYAGTPDRVKFDPAVVLDIKTGAYEPWHALQGAAYASMLENSIKYRRIGLYLSADGTYSIREFPQKDYPGDIAVFLSCLNVLSWKRKVGL